MEANEAAKLGRSVMSDKNESNMIPDDGLTLKSQDSYTEIFGREMELGVIKNAIACLDQENGSVCLEVSGEAGAGKTYLVKHAFGYLSQVHVFNASFNRDSVDRPYHIINSLFEQLIRFLKDMKSDSEMSAWYKSLSEAFADLPYELLTNLSFLPTSIFSSNRKSGNQVNPTILKDLLDNLYLKLSTLLFKEIDRKIVLIIENMHYSDERSLVLLFKIFGQINLPLMIVLVGRPGEWQDLRLQMLKEGEGEHHHEQYTINLGSLSLEDTKRFIKDKFSQGIERDTELGQLLYDTTNGNIGALHETLNKLRQDDGVCLDEKSGKWKWSFDPERFKSKMSMVSLFMQKFDEFSSEARDILYFSSCLQYNINPAVVAKLTSYDVDKSNEILEDCCDKGFIDVELVSTQYGSQSKNNYHFSSEEVAQAIRSRIEAVKAQHCHRNIANHLSSKSAIGIADRDVFEAVYHLNQSMDLNFTPDEKLTYVNLNLQAARKSRLGTSFKSGYEYVKNAIQFTENQKVSLDSGMLKELYLEAYQLARLNGDEVAQNEYMSFAQSNFDRDGVFEIKFLKLVLDVQFGMLQEGLNSGVELLQELGLRVKASSGKITVLLEFLKAKRLLSKISIEEIYNLPEVKDKQLEQIFQVIFWMFRASQYLAPELNGVLALKQLQLMLKHGTNGDSWSGLMAYGVIIGAGMNDYNTAFEYSHLGVRLAEKHGNKSGKVSFGKAIYWPFRNALTETVDIYEEAKFKQYNEGDYVGAAEATVNESLTHFSIGKSLDDQIVLAHENFAFCDKVSALNFRDFQRMMILMLSRLKNGSEVSEQTLELNKINSETEYAITKSVMLIFNMVIAVLKDDFDEAIEIAKTGKKQMQNLTGLYFKTEYEFYHALAMLKSMEKSNSKKYMRKIDRIIKKFEKWTAAAPANYEPKLLFLLGVKDVVNGDYQNGQEKLLKARILANSFGNKQWEMLANREMANLAIKNGETSNGEKYLAEAERSLADWGINWK